MPTNALVQARIDPAVKERAAAVLEELGITVSHAVRILLTRTANEGALPFALTKDAAAHDAWFRAKVQGALGDSRPAIAQKIVELRAARKRAAALRKGSPPPRMTLAQINAEIRAARREREESKPSSTKKTPKRPTLAEQRRRLKTRKAVTLPLDIARLVREGRESR